MRLRRGTGPQGPKKTKATRFGKIAFGRQRIHCAKCGRADGDRRGPILRKSVRAGTDRGERNRRGAGLQRELEAPAIAGLEQLVLPVMPATPDRADSVHDVPRGQVESARHARITGRAPSDAPALVKKGRPRGTVYGAIHPASAKQARIGGIDDRVHREPGDVGDDDFDHRAASSFELQRERPRRRRLRSPRSPSPPSRTDIHAGSITAFESSGYAAVLCGMAIASTK